MSSENFNLTWTSHPLASTNLLVKLLRDQELTDVTLVCGDGQEVDAHKAVLGSVSTVFKKIFKRGGQERIVLYLSGISLSNLEAIINFIYLGEATVNQSCIDSFFRICKEFQIEGLSDYSIVPTSKESLSSTTPSAVKLEAITQDVEKNQSLIDIYIETDQEMFPCELCDFETSCQESLTSHKATLHSEEPMVHLDEEMIEKIIHLTLNK